MDSFLSQLTISLDVILDGFLSGTLCWEVSWPLKIDRPNLPLRIEKNSGLSSPHREVSGLIRSCARSKARSKPGHGAVVCDKLGGRGQPWPSRGQIRPWGLPRAKLLLWRQWWSGGIPTVSRPWEQKRETWKSPSKHQPSSSACPVFLWMELFSSLAATSPSLHLNPDPLWHLPAKCVLVYVLKLSALL